MFLKLWLDIPSVLNVGLNFFPTGILVTATKDKENHYSYNTVTVVLLTEFLKLLVSVGLQMRTYVETAKISASLLILLFCI